MAQPPILKAKLSDRPALRDLANFVVPKASARWYNLGLQLFDPQDEGLLSSMKTESSKRPEEQCTEVFHHWLTTKKNATWNKLIKGLKSPAVNLPNVASTIENMLDSRSIWAKGKHKISKKLHRQSSSEVVQTPSPIPENVTSSYESSDGERNDKSDDMAIQTSHCKRHSLHRTDSVYSMYYMNKSTFVPMTVPAVRNHLRCRSTASLPAAFDSQGYDDERKLNDTFENFKRLGEQQKLKSEKENAERLAEMYKTMYEKEEKRLNDVEDQLRKRSEEGVEIIKQFVSLQNKQLENQRSTYGKNATEQDLFGDTYRKELDNLQCKVDVILEEVEKLKKSKEIHMKELELEILEEFKRKVDRMLKDSEEAQKNEIEYLINKTYSKEKALIEKLEKDVTQLRNKLSAYEKQWEDSQFDQEFEDNLKKSFCKELNSREEIFEKKINRVIDEQLKNDKEVFQKELQLKVEHLRKLEAKKREDSEEAQRTELNELQLKIKEIESREETNDRQINNAIDILNKQLKDSEEVHRKELYSLKIKIEQLEREKLKEEKENILAFSTEELKIEECKILEEQNKEIEMLKRDNEQLKIQLDLIQKTIASKEAIKNENIDISISDKQNTKEHMQEKINPNEENGQELVEYISLLDNNNVRSDNMNTEDDEPSDNVHNENDNGESKEETVSNGVAFINRPCGDDSSIDAVFTSPNQKHTSDNSNPSLQPISNNSFNNGDNYQEFSDEENDSSSKSSQDGTAVKPIPYPMHTVCKQLLDGRMIIDTWSYKLPGYEHESYGTIEITYQFPSGKQNEEHPNPGQHYHGTNRIAYIPDSPEGRKVVQLLGKAFDAQLIFKVGRTVIGDALVWNDIHHKTNIEGGSSRSGYPDSEYLDTVLEQLAAKGIKE